MTPETSGKGRALITAGAVLCLVIGLPAPQWLACAHLPSGLWGAPVAQAQARRRRRRWLRVRIVDISGDRAYISVGREDGLRRGDMVTFGRRRYPVASVSEGFSAIDLHPGRTTQLTPEEAAAQSADDAGSGEAQQDAGEAQAQEPDQAPQDQTPPVQAQEIPTSRLRIGARGRARASGSDEDEGEDVQRLPPIRPAATYRGQWPDAGHPADDQNPDHVALGGAGMGSAGSGNRLVVSLDGLLLQPLSNPEDTIVRTMLRARLHAEQLGGIPLSVDADVAGQLWIASDFGERAAGESQPPLRVRQLQIAYGAFGDFYAALGRLRYAAATLGQLDGLRVSAPSLGPVTLSAFGGIVPNAQSGVPSVDIARFGAEADIRDLESDLRPQMSLVAQGSVFNGQVDERRLSALFHIYPGDSHLGGQVEVSAFDGDNVWGAPQVDLTAASIDGGLRLDWFRLGGSFSMRQPERSKWLDSLLPQGWACTPITDDAGSDVCGPGQRRYLGRVDAGVELTDLSFTAGATLITQESQDYAQQINAFAAFRATRIMQVARLDLGASMTQSYFYTSYGVRGELNVAITPEFEVAARYRPAFSRYFADTDPFLEQLAGGSVRIRPISGLLIQVDVDALLGRQVDALLARLNLTWRTGF